jgi:hypothetical protein
MNKIVNLHTVRTNSQVRPQTLEDLTLVDEGFAVRNGLVLEDLEDEFGMHLCGYAFGGSVYIMMPEDYEETVAGHRVVSWLVYCLTDGSTRPVAFARTETLIDKFNDMLDRRDAEIQQRRKATLKLVAA